MRKAAWTQPSADAGSASETLRKPQAHLVGTNLGSAHLHNQRVVLETVRRYGPLSRADITSRTSLSAQTISNIVEKLLDQGTLTTSGRRVGQRGQPAIELEINPGGGYAVGLHVDRDHLTGVLLDLVGTPLQIKHREWNLPTPEQALPLVSETVQSLIIDQGLELSDLWGVGVGLPGPLDLRHGGLVNPPNFPGWDGIPLRQILSDALGLPVFLDTDATAAAVGERWFGQGRDVHDYFYVYFGIGLGGGMILGGKPYRGGLDNAAIFGHIPVDPSGRRCGCGGTGCLELYASLGSLYASLPENGGKPHSIAELAELFRAENAALMEWLASAADHLAVGLVTLENLLSPNAVIFGGRLPAAVLDWIIARIAQRLPNLQMRGLAQHPLLLRAEGAEDAAALGAATLPLFEIITPEHYVQPTFGALPSVPLSERSLIL